MNTIIRESTGMRVALGKMQPEFYRMALGESFKNLPTTKKDIGQGLIYLECDQNKKKSLETLLNQHSRLYLYYSHSIVAGGFEVTS